LCWGFPNGEEGNQIVDVDWERREEMELIGFHQEARQLKHFMLRGWCQSVEVVVIKLLIGREEKK
jgi:hypothetical protein